jgi:hypothetical protein
MTYIKKNPPENRWRSLVAQSIHDPETIDWLESNIENVLRGYLLEIGYYGNIDRIFPTPCQENHWLYDPETDSCTGYFIACYEGLYGAWSHDYAYRSRSVAFGESHLSHLDFKSCSSYYKAGDPPESVVEEFRSQGKEIALWDGICSKDHPILQKAKAECEVLGLNKSIATRIWNKATPETFESAWEARKQK